MEQNHIIEKIKKLLTMAARGTTHEREVAYIKAQEMMAKYHIDKSQVATIELEKVVRLTVHEVNVKHEVYLDLANVIGKNFRCKTFSTFYRKTWISAVFLGTEVDAEVAATIFKDAAAYAKKEAERIAHYYYNKLGACTGVRGEWLTGFVQGLRKGFTDQIQSNSSTAIMVVIPQCVQDEHDKIKFSKTSVSLNRASRNGDAALFNAGHESGYNFSMKRRQAALAESED